MNERLDALLSARRDGDLDASERAELDRLLAASEAARRRAVEFERVDESLRALAAAPVADERLARTLAALAQRPEIAASRRPARGLARLPRRRRWALAAAAAVAAVWIVTLVLPRAGTDAGDEVAPEDLAALGLDRAGDLEVIEQLELLEFLADREPDGEGPRG